MAMLAAAALAGCKGREDAAKKFLNKCNVKPAPSLVEKYAKEAEPKWWSSLRGFKINAKCPLNKLVEIREVKVPVTKACPPSAGKCDGVSALSIKSYRETVERFLAKKKLKNNHEVKAELQSALKNLEKTKTKEAEERMQEAIETARTALREAGTGRPWVRKPPKNGMTPGMTSGMDPVFNP